MVTALRGRRPGGRHHPLGTPRRALHRAPSQDHPPARGHRRWATACSSAGSVRSGCEGCADCGGATTVGFDPSATHVRVVHRDPWKSMRGFRGSSAASASLQVEAHCQRSRHGPTSQLNHSLTSAPPNSGSSKGDPTRTVCSQECDESLRSQDPVRASTQLRNVQRTRLLPEQETVRRSRSVTDQPKEFRQPWPPKCVKFSMMHEPFLNPKRLKSNHFGGKMAQGPLWI